MRVERHHLPAAPALARLRSAAGETKLALYRDGVFRDLTQLADPASRTLDGLLSLSMGEMRRLLESRAIERLPAVDIAGWEWQAPVESQEVWAAGVTYLRSREARMEEAAAGDVYALVYKAERPELFFKAAGWRVVPPGGRIGIRSDSTWDVPEPELAVLSNAAGEVVAYAGGNDMSSRSIEGENPLYLPQAKVYDASCSIGPVAVLAWHTTVENVEIRMVIERDGTEVFAGAATTRDLVRDPKELAGVLHAAYTLPAGAWLLTGTSIVPPLPYTAREGDLVDIAIEGIGRLRNQVKRIPHSGARALPRLRAGRD